MHKASAYAGSGKGYIAFFSCDRDLGEMLAEISIGYGYDTNVTKFVFMQYRGSSTSLESYLLLYIFFCIASNSSRSRFCVCAC